uniref:Attachment glycoprotein n=1 Tax=avian metapneumovirus TaxID=38525 RepID=A0A481Y5B5_9MONO|nr:attachment glycoprotein [Avian metapneumovirus]
MSKIDLLGQPKSIYQYILYRLAVSLKQITTKVVTIVVLCVLGATGTIDIGLGLTASYRSSALGDCLNQRVTEHGNLYARNITACEGGACTYGDQPTTRPSSTVSTVRESDKEKHICHPVQVIDGDEHSVAHHVLDRYNCMDLLAVCRTSELCPNHLQSTNTIRCECSPRKSGLKCCRHQNPNTASNDTVNHHPGNTSSTPATTAKPIQDSTKNTTQSYVKTHKQTTTTEPISKQAPKIPQQTIGRTTQHLGHETDRPDKKEAIKKGSPTTNANSNTNPTTPHPKNQTATTKQSHRGNTTDSLKTAETPLKVSKHNHNNHPHQETTHRPHITGRTGPTSHSKPKNSNTPGEKPRSVTNPHSEQQTLQDTNTTCTTLKSGICSVVSLYWRNKPHCNKTKKCPLLYDCFDLDESKQTCPGRYLCFCDYNYGVSAYCCSRSPWS